MRIHSIYATRVLLPLVIIMLITLVGCDTVGSTDLTSSTSDQNVVEGTSHTPVEATIDIEDIVPSGSDGRSYAITFVVSHNTSGVVTAEAWLDDHRDRATTVLSGRGTNTHALLLRDPSPLTLRAHVALLDAAGRVLAETSKTVPTE
jgi:hypothetical protein